MKFTSIFFTASASIFDIYIKEGVNDRQPKMSVGQLTVFPPCKKKANVMQFQPNIFR